MIRRMVWVSAATLSGLAMLAFVLWLGPWNTVLAAPAMRYVATTGSDTANDCSDPGNPCETIQHAIDQASDWDEILVAGGTYARVGTVAGIDKPLTLRGGHGPGFGFDPDMYQTVLDAGWGGSAVSATNVAEARLEHLTITHGDGSENVGAGTGGGGGIYADDVELFVGWCHITDNVGSSAGRGWGGGVYVGNDTNNRSTTILHSSIVSNTASISATASGDGGGLYVFYGSISLVESTIEDNLGHASRTGHGGGAHFTYVSGGQVQSSTIKGNVASGSGFGLGGGIYASSCSGLEIVGNRIEANEADQGGGLNSAWSDIHVTRNRIVNNSAGGGGGLYIRSLTPITVSNNLIVSNTASFRGSGVYVVNSSLPPSEAYLVNNTIADNTGSGVDGWQNVVITLTNNLIAGNQVGITASIPASATVTADTNLFWNTSDPITGTNGIMQDPKTWSDYRLREGSPALDAGLDISWLTTDIEGNPRTLGEYDIGAYEGEWWEVFLPLVLRE